MHTRVKIDIENVRQYQKEMEACWNTSRIETLEWVKNELTDVGIKDYSILVFIDTELKKLKDE